MISRMTKLFCAHLILCLILGTALACSCQSVAAQPAGQNKPPEAAQTPTVKHSLPEERQRVVAIAHKLEAAPLDPALGSDREWAVKWIFSSPDVPVHLCTRLLSDLRRPRYKYKSEIGSQLLISTAAFIIEHPEKASDNLAKSVDGMEGVLKAYMAILKTDPQATAQSLDAYLQKQKEGKLADVVREKTKECY